LRLRLFGLSIFVGGANLIAGCRRMRLTLLAKAEQNLPRSSLALVPDHHYVVTGALQELGEHVARLTGPIDAEHPLIRIQTLDLCAGSGGDIVQDLLEAGVLGIDAEPLAVPVD